VNCIIRGTFDTDATAGVIHDPANLLEVVGRIALRRVGSPDEVVGAALYFASDASSYTTGSCLTVDGGV
jgi:NAD(P)-dependent dehydrogenase (short-subunit alcohol dehydrogenase family)